MMLNLYLIVCFVNSCDKYELIGYQRQTQLYMNVAPWWPERPDQETSRVNTQAHKVVMVAHLMHVWMSTVRVIATRDMATAV